MASADSLRRLDAEPRWIDARCVQMIAAVSRLRFGAHLRAPCTNDRVFTRQGTPLRAIDFSRDLAAPLAGPPTLWQAGVRNPWILAAEYIIAFRDQAAALGRDAALVGVSCAGVFLLVNGLQPGVPPRKLGQLTVNLHRWPRETIAAWLHQ